MIWLSLGRFPLRALHGIIVELIVKLCTYQRIDSKSISSASVSCACWLGIDSKSILWKVRVLCSDIFFGRKNSVFPKKIWKNIRIIFLHVSYVPGEAFFFQRKATNLSILSCTSTRVSKSWLTVDTYKISRIYNMVKLNIVYTSV